MNSTNRALNRLLILIVGLVLFVAGAAVAIGGFIPDVQEQVSSATESAASPVADALGAQPWILWVTAVVALALIVLLLVFIFRQGRGHTSTLLRVGEGSGQNTPTGGNLTIDVKVAAEVLEDAIGRNPDVVSVDVSGFRVRNENVLRVTANARRGASPIDIRSAVDTAVAQWDEVLGTQIPVVIQINGGLRTRTTNATARVV